MVICPIKSDLGIQILCFVVCSDMRSLSNCENCNAGLIPCALYSAQVGDHLLLNTSLQLGIK